jgi:uncharacterized protein YecE (DUF72 family)
MGALLVQFPPSFVADSFGKQILRAITNAFGEYLLAVELRHKSWSDDPAIADLLRDANACWVQIDEPKFDFSVALEVPVTSDISYFRFHGRNAEMWWKGDVETRYKYLYSPLEIHGLAEKVKASSSTSKTTFAFFNNHWQGFAPRNAADLKNALQIPFIDFQTPLFSNGG